MDGSSLEKKSKLNRFGRLKRERHIDVTWETNTYNLNWELGGKKKEKKKNDVRHCKYPLQQFKYVWLTFSLLDELSEPVWNVTKGLQIFRLQRRQLYTSRKIGNNAYVNV